VKFQKTLTDLPLKNVTDDSYPGTFAFEFFEAVGVSMKAARTLITTCEAAISLLMQGYYTAVVFCYWLLTLKNPNALNPNSI
jgi:hypothetical protein